MICIEEFKHKDMIYMGCGNGHKTCKSCYNTLTNYTNKCPMCRGDL